MHHGDPRTRASKIKKSRTGPGHGRETRTDSDRSLPGSMVQLMIFLEFYDLHDCMDSKCPIEKLDEPLKKGFQVDADW